jgi:hypothetical protein
VDQSLDLRVSLLDGIEVGLADLDSRRFSSVQQRPDLIDGEFLDFHNAPWRFSHAAKAFRLSRIATAWDPSAKGNSPQ